MKSSGDFEDILAADKPDVWQSNRPAKGGEAGEMLAKIIERAAQLKSGKARTPEEQSPSAKSKTAAPAKKKPAATRKTAVKKKVTAKKKPTAKATAAKRKES